MSEMYSKRELDLHFTEIKSTLGEIKTQVQKTNGRVSSLEKWRWVVTGAIMALAATSFPTLAQVAKAISGI